MIDAGSAVRTAGVTAAAVGGAGLLLGAEAAVTAVRAGRHVIRPAYQVDHVAGSSLPGRPLGLAMLGDSTVAGVGAARELDSLAVQVATRASEALGRPVHVTGYGVSGARASHVLRDQLPLLRAARGDHDAVVVVVGGNDVTHFTPLGRFERTYAAVLDGVRSARPGAATVAVGAGRFIDAFAVPRPLRDAWDGYSRVVASRQEQVALREGAQFVDIARDSSLRWRGRRDSVAADGFHPSVLGYGLWADAIAPGLVQALQQAGPAASAASRRVSP